MATLKILIKLQILVRQAQLAGDGTYPWGENLMVKRAKNFTQKQNNKGLKVSNAKKGSVG